MENIFKIIGGLIIVKLLWKYRWDIFGAYVDLIEPHESDNLAVEYVTEQAETDYDDIRLFISACANKSNYQEAMDQIHKYQEEYKGLIHEQRVNDMLGLLEDKYTGQQAILN